MARIIKPLAIDLFSGRGGWTRGLLGAGFHVVGFDIERWLDYPGELVIQDVQTLHGSQFRDAALIVASPPCQEYSYRAMPWKRAKALPPPDNTLFETCFRLQREAIQATGRTCCSCGGEGRTPGLCRCEMCDGSGVQYRYIPLVVENVKGAQPWVGRARWHFGSFFLWGDVPALMPPTVNRRMKFPAHCGPRLWRDRKLDDGANPAALHFKGFGGSWFAENHNTNSGSAGNPVNGSGVKVPGHINKRNGHGHTRHLTNPVEQHEGVKQGGEWWHDSKPGHIRSFSSKSDSRKAASAQIAMIPYPLARWIGEVYRCKD